MIAIMRVSEEETWPKLTVLTVKATGEVNHSLNHKRRSGTSMRKAQVKHRLLPDLAAEFPG